MNEGVYSVTFVDEQGRGKAFGAMSLWDDNAIFLPEVMTGYRNWFRCSLGEPTRPHRRVGCCKKSGEAV